MIRTHSHPQQGQHPMQMDGASCPEGKPKQPKLPRASIRPAEHKVAQHWCLVQSTGKIIRLTHQLLDGKPDWSEVNVTWNRDCIRVPAQFVICQSLVTLMSLVTLQSLRSLCRQSLTQRKLTQVQIMCSCTVQMQSQVQVRYPLGNFHWEC